MKVLQVFSLGVLYRAGQLMQGTGSEALQLAHLDWLACSRLGSRTPSRVYAWTKRFLVTHLQRLSTNAAEMGLLGGPQQM